MHLHDHDDHDDHDVVNVVNVAPRETRVDPRDVDV